MMMMIGYRRRAEEFGFGEVAYHGWLYVSAMNLVVLVLCVNSLIGCGFNPDLASLFAPSSLLLRLRRC